MKEAKDRVEKKKNTEERLGNRSLGGIQDGNDGVRREEGNGEGLAEQETIRPNRGEYEEKKKGRNKKGINKPTYTEKNNAIEVSPFSCIVRPSRQRELLHPSTLSVPLPQTSL